MLFLLKNFRYIFTTSKSRGKIRGNKLHTKHSDIKSGIECPPTWIHYFSSIFPHFGHTMWPNHRKYK